MSLQDGLEVAGSKTFTTLANPPSSVSVVSSSVTSSTATVTVSFTNGGENCSVNLICNGSNKGTYTNIASSKAFSLTGLSSGTSYTCVGTVTNSAGSATGSKTFTTLTPVQRIQISSTTTRSNYPMLFTINTETLISQGKMLSTCADMRFKASDLTTGLDYWIESGCNTTQTKVWVKVPSISTSSTTIYMIYTGEMATTESSEIAVFGEVRTVSDWELDGNATDSWGSNNGTATDVTYETETNCISGECGIFNGSTSYVDCGNASSLDITGNLTISLGVIRFDTFSPTKIISRGSAITNNKWHHIVVTKNGTGIGSVKIYNDGIDVTSQQGDHGNPASNNKHAYIGSYNSIAHFLNGEIDEVRVYNSVISESEIEQKYLSGLYIKQ